MTKTKFIQANTSFYSLSLEEHTQRERDIVMHILLLVVHHRQGKRFSDDRNGDHCYEIILVLHSKEIEHDDEKHHRQHYRNHL